MASAKSLTRAESGKVRRVVVVGGGLAGLMTVIKLCEAGVPVDLFSLVPVKRSHSVCAQGGINASVNTKGEGDSPAGAPRRDGLRRRLPRQPAARQGHGRRGAGHRLHARPHGRPVQPHARGPARLPPLRRHALSPHGVRRRDDGPAAPLRARRAGAPLGDRRRRGRQGRARAAARRWSASSSSGTSSRLVLDDDGVCRGIVAQDLKIDGRSSRSRATRCASRPGGCGIVFGRSTNSVINTGTAASAAYQQGACYANGEFIQVHPTAIPGADKLRLISESVRGEGGRVWVPTDAEGEAPRARRPRERPRLLPRGQVPGLRQPRPARHREPRALQEVLPREARRLQPEERQERERGLPRRHAPAAASCCAKKLAGVLEIYEKFVGEDPYENPMRVFPAVHYSMGGLWVDFERARDGSARRRARRATRRPTSPGLYAVGEVDYQYHGANRLGANSLLSCIYGGHGHRARHRDVPEEPRDGARGTCRASLFDKAEQREQKKYDAILAMDGDENPYRAPRGARRRRCSLDVHDRAPQRQARRGARQDRGDRRALAGASA